MVDGERRTVNGQRRTVNGERPVGKPSTVRRWPSAPYLFCLLLFLLPLQSIATDTLWLSIPFYSEEIQLRHLAVAPIRSLENVREEPLVDWYRQLQAGGQFQTLLYSLTAAKERLQLNDWLYYELIREVAASQAAGGSSLQQRLLCWFLLSESGYDTRLTFLENQVFVYAYTEEGIFDTPMIVEEGRKYINLSSIHERMSNPSVALQLLHFEARPGGKVFSFHLKQWPLLNPLINEQVVHFSWRGQKFSFQVTLDKTVANFMSHYPVFEEYRYLEVPLSTTLAQSLLPQLREVLAGKQQKEALEILAAFTRSAFRYKEDRDHFGKNKPMIADEVFHYPYSDCEDRSALFFNLVRSLLDLPMIVIAYPDHLTIAVALDQPIGPAIRYRDRAYYICDPTGPSNSAVIGQVPEGYEEISFEILGEYR